MEEKHFMSRVVPEYLLAQKVFTLIVCVVEER